MLSPEIFHIYFVCIILLWSLKTYSFKEKEPTQWKMNLTYQWFFLLFSLHDHLWSFIIVFLFPREKIHKKIKVWKDSKLLTSLLKITVYLSSKNKPSSLDEHFSLLRKSDNFWGRIKKARNFFLSSVNIFYRLSGKQI